LPPLLTVELDLFSWRRVGELVPRSCDVPSTLARVSRAAWQAEKVCDARLGEGQNAQLAGEDGGGQRKDGEAPESSGDGCCNTLFWMLD